ncbi:MerR family transcriptional regulator [Candidatus Galacturonibacter soehngenii]|uniref:MerR family transcriptional regulator n=1 Tax=Candidatus Galacturonatibacter soehngenii TaxID=2307010 RepID=A0A7V7QJ90_9FIRM|nr:MerR family transcriptional regulator [Candidatus Galacturonibacter soehngenii]KAB1436009.1 MerR family transcriptional regulator [Candidatus Galacturonibacter soehngenii]
MEKYTSSELANLYQIHPNTIRLYERLGYITPSKRSANNYRVFTKLHVLQVKICRCIFGYPFTNKTIRNAGNEVMWASSKQDFRTGKQNAKQYIQIIEQELDIATKTTSLLYGWANEVKPKQFLAGGDYLSRKEVAAYFNTTVESVRNWERNRLIYSVREGEKGERLYSSSDFNRISIIYMLIQAGFSIASIQRSLVTYENGYKNEIITALNHPKYEELTSVGDRWIYELTRLKQAAKAIPSIFEELMTL